MRRLLEFLRVGKKTYFSYCMAGCQETGSAGYDLIAHELHDNDTAIQDPDRWPLVASYMTGHPSLPALIFTTIRADDPRILCIDRGISERRRDWIIYNPAAERVTTRVTAPEHTVMVTLEPGQWLSL